MHKFDFEPESGRIGIARQRLKNAYMRKPQAEIPVVEPNGFSAVYSPQEAFENLDKMLANASGWANHLALTDNDWTPVISCYCTVVMIPNAFSCEVIYPPGQSPWAKHRIDDIKKVYNLKPKRPSEVAQIVRQLEWIDYAQRRLGTAVPMWTPDIQSPFSVAAQIVEPQELLLACHSDPKAVHHICQMITDYTIEVWELLLEAIEHPGFPGANFPCISDNIGLCLADDTSLIMLSPSFYKEYALPYNSQLGRFFGGIHIHSCGNYQHNLDNLLKTENIRSIQLHAGPGEFPLPENASENCAFNRARNMISYFVDVNPISRGDRYRGRYREFFSEYLLPRLRSEDMTGCILQGCGFSDGAAVPEIAKSLKWTREQLLRS